MWENNRFFEMTYPIPTQYTIYYTHKQILSLSETNDSWDLNSKRSTFFCLYTHTIFTQPIIGYTQAACPGYVIIITSLSVWIVVELSDCVWKRLRDEEDQLLLTSGKNMDFCLLDLYWDATSTFLSIYLYIYICVCVCIYLHMDVLELSDCVW
jgi:hypothetical protein